MARRHKRRRQRSILLGALFALVMGIAAGSAFGFITAPGSGTGLVVSGATQHLTVSATAGTPATPLLPGGTGDVAIVISNPNNVSITVVSVTQNGPIMVESGLSSCTPTVVEFSNQTGLNDTIGAGRTARLDLPGAASMDANAPSGCEGATFAIPVTISVVTS